MDNLRGLIGIRSMDRVSNGWIRELCEVKKGLDWSKSVLVVLPCGEGGEG